jgi:DNA polymerase delta subunit 2
MTETPHVYFAGNQPAFAEKLVEQDGVKARVILVPSFAKTSTIVLLNLRTLECEPVSFNLSP